MSLLPGFGQTKLDGVRLVFENRKILIPPAHPPPEPAAHTPGGVLRISDAFGAGTAGFWLGGRRIIPPLLLGSSRT